ncbi:MAG: hypothetical protein ACOC80_08110 [Petrotogales bacterium]
MKRAEWLKNNTYDIHSKLQPSLSSITKNNIDLFITEFSDERLILVIHKYNALLETLLKQHRNNLIEMNLNNYIGKPQKDAKVPKLHFINMFDGFIALLISDNFLPEDFNLFLKKSYTALKYNGKGLIICNISELEGAKEHQRKLHKQGIPSILGEIIENGVYQFSPPLNVLESIIKRSGFVIEDCSFEETYKAFIVVQK